ncbi:MAG: galactokinase [Candidatus Marinimicrobia bacterium]|jgi:galactokinase|nr:galactokinase [Candidatus Neomarinimicrobiota bacterium]MBT3635109.1 galactokinase [Candidatus Neomarinimicrobiota bacterium]MBT3683159.1 galactokinase [Candidatus Neomarinimicrobiota bacterium]MBT3759793.1 galactokinase [Candidatus Neomarinimicrobiota bacterium]MBT3895801.1 galactokinase [Candidatus Neomarinimicrobiota bacterium]
MTKWIEADIKNAIISQVPQGSIQDLFGDIDFDSSKLFRICDLINKSETKVTHIISAPGRTELGGNHTDHNGGKVLCAAIQIDTLAAVSKTENGKISIHSNGFDESFFIDSSDLALNHSEYGTTQALIRGVLAGAKKFGGKIGGFTAEISSNVGIGSGLSSSASFEVLIATIVNDLYNDGNIHLNEIAQIGQYAENIYFGKPCGLMDQTASAVGGILKIDFGTIGEIDIQQIQFDMSKTDYELLVVNTGGGHASLTAAYAAIPDEMKAVANELGFDSLGSCEESIFIENLTKIRSQLGDRSVLRAMHYYSENRRVDEMVEALIGGDFELYLEKVAQSGYSSQNILQNVIPPQSDGKNQNLGFALALSQLFFEKKGRGVSRVHGGGFAGTIQAYVHKDDFDEFSLIMNDLVGPFSTEKLKIRNHGAKTILRIE